MGDAGSMFLGFVLAWYLIHFSQGEGRLISPATALWLLGIPLIDTVTMMLRRVMKKRSPFEPDREHFHHVLQLAGFSPMATLFIMAAVSALMAVIGLVAHYQGVPEWVMFYAFLLLFAGYFWTIRRAWKVMRFLKRSINRRRADRRQINRTFEGAERRSGKDRRHPGA
jgi:UDP-GlcNAc:undecaprenyl-phosphate GlcNAc-1-phosphate transferase